MLVLTAGTGAGHQLRANATDWISALTAAGCRVAANAVDSFDRIDAAHVAHLGSQAADRMYLVERYRVARVERISDSDKPWIALVVAALLVVLAVLERLDAIVAANSVGAGSASTKSEAKPVPNQIFHPPAMEPATPPRSRIQCLGAQNESEIIARHADRPATRSVAAVLRHRIN
ncbi:MAG TPA: hypothetical protein VEU51_18920 [Candidatus Acidoferrales bacterium]|nr:hypothetical protein [Candidatus Acidoferrales bacterium]